jgi:hypothetical protein
VFHPRRVPGEKVRRVLVGDVHQQPGLPRVCTTVCTMSPTIPRVIAKLPVNFPYEAPRFPRGSRPLKSPGGNPVRVRIPARASE